MTQRDFAIVLETLCLKAVSKHAAAGANADCHDSERRLLAGKGGQALNID